MPNNIYLVDKIPTNMKTPFWVDFISAIEEEFYLIYDKIDEDRNLYDIKTMDYERMVDITTILNLPFDISANDNDSFLRKETKAISFKYSYKDTYTLYNSLFFALDKLGEVFIYYWTGQELIRNSLSMLNDAIIDPSLPVPHRSSKNFTGTINEALKLDSGWYLDETIPKKLDQSLIKLSAKHLGMEYFLTNVISSENHKYLIDTKYFSYINTNVDQLKKISEVSHIGCQLTAVLDSSGVFDSYTNQSGEDKLKLAYDFNNSDEGFIVYHLDPLVNHSTYIEVVKLADYSDSFLKKDFGTAIINNPLNPLKIALRFKKVYGNLNTLGISIGDSSEDYTSLGEYSFIEDDTDWVSLEYTISTGIASIKYLMLEFNNSSFGTIYVDWVKIFQPNDSGNDYYTTPPLELKAIGKSTNSSLTTVDITHVVVGSGSIQNLKRKNSLLGIVPTALNNKLAKLVILSDEKYNNSEYLACSVNYPAKMVNDVFLDGTGTHYTKTLPHIPVKPGNVRIRYPYSASTLDFEDDGFGNFKSENGTGTINYETGEIDIYTIGQYLRTNESMGASGQTVYSYTNSPIHRPISQGSITLKYQINGINFRAVDNGSGQFTNFSGSGIVSSNINYSLGQIAVTFSTPTSANVLLDYTYTVPKTPTFEDQVEVQYYFLDSTVDITEAGVLKGDGTLVAYATFPPIRFDKVDHHLSMGFIIKKGLF